MTIIGIVLNGPDTPDGITRGGAAIGVILGTTTTIIGDSDMAAEDGISDGADGIPAIMIRGILGIRDGDTVRAMVRAGGMTTGTDIILTSAGRYITEEEVKAE